MLESLKSSGGSGWLQHVAVLARWLNPFRPSEVDESPGPPSPGAVTWRVLVFTDRAGKRFELLAPLRSDGAIALSLGQDTKIVPRRTRTGASPAWLKAMGHHLYLMSGSEKPRRLSMGPLEPGESWAHELRLIEITSSDAG